MTSLSNDVIVRDVYQSDIKFIFDSWLRSWRTSPWAGVIPNNVYYPLTRSVIEQLVGRGATFKVACLANDNDKILGWVCYEVPDQTTVIHYIYIKDAYIPFDIGQLLLDATPGSKPGFFTFRYRQVSDICTYDKGWKHAPEIARRK